MRSTHARPFEPENNRCRAVRESHAQIAIQHHNAERQRAHERIKTVVRRLRVLRRRFANRLSLAALSTQQQTTRNAHYERGGGNGVGVHYSLNI